MAVTTNVFPSTTMRLPVFISMFSMSLLPFCDKCTSTIEQRHEDRLDIFPIQRSVSTFYARHANVLDITDNKQD
jgi:hypothetical protein